MKRFVSVAIMMIFLSSPVFAKRFITMEFRNTTDHKVYYFLYWIDHPFVNSPEPVNMIGGELEANESWDVETAYVPGTYGVLWRSGEGKILKAEEFKITDETKVTRVLR